MQPYYILEGPPGAGKSTVLDLLADQMPVIAEPARRVLLQQRAIGGRGTGEQDPALFIRLMRDTILDDYTFATGPTVFDRGLPGLLAFCEYYGISSSDIRRHIKHLRYNRTVFWFPPWQDIYKTDAERQLDFEGAAQFGHLVRQSYLQSGYVLVPVPKTTPEQRAAFILNQIAG